MDWKLELVPMPISDVDRAKAFYAEKVGFNVDLDVSADTDPRVSGERLVVQLTPPGAACSTDFGIGTQTRHPELRPGPALGRPGHKRRPCGAHRPGSRGR